MIPSQSSVKAQIRLEQCRLKKSAAPAEYCIGLAYPDNEDHEHKLVTPWKESKGDIISFKCFLRFTVKQQYNKKCELQLISRHDGRQAILGIAPMTLSESKCNIKKYLIRSHEQTVATIDISLFLKKKENSQPSLQNHLSRFSLQSHFSTISRQDSSLQTDSILDHLHSENQITQKRNKFKISNEIEIKNQKNHFDASNAIQLLLPLFEQIANKNAEITKQQEAINQRDQQIKYMKINQLIFQRNDKKIEKLKKQSKFLLAVNQFMQCKDEKYEEQYSNMKLEKEGMAKRICEVSKESSQKIIKLKAQLEAAKKKLIIRDKKLSGLTQQNEAYTAKITELTVQNKQKTKLISILKSELNNEELSSQPVDFLSQFIEKLVHHQPPQKQVKIVAKEHSEIERRKLSSEKLKKVKSFSLFNRNNLITILNPETYCQEIQNQYYPSNHQASNIFEYLLGISSNHV